MNELYKKYKSPADFAKAKPEVLEKELSSINFFRNKTKSVLNCSKALVEKHGGEVPKSNEWAYGACRSRAETEMLCLETASEFRQ